MPQFLGKLGVHTTNTVAKFQSLSDVERGLIQIALHACFTAFNPDAARRLVRMALNAGSVALDILQAMQLGAHPSVQGTALGATEMGELRAPASSCR